MAIVAMYVILGTIISYFFGREPSGQLPPNVLQELAPSMIVLCLFLTYYECGDCLGVGIAKGKTWHGMVYKDYAGKVVPEPVYLAQRALTNQGEQLPVLLVGTMACAIYVNGIVAAILSGIWCLLRIRYAMVYRASVGLTLDQVMSRIGTYTVPAYFFANTLVWAAAIHAIRCLL
jgi:MAPEG family